MIFDNTLLFSDAQAITNDVPSNNVIDLSVTGTPIFALSPLNRDMGAGCKIPIMVQINETFNNLTSLQILMQTDDNSAFSSPRTIAGSGPIELARLVAGAEVDFPDCIPQGAKERYFRLFYDISGIAPTTGRITAGVVAARQAA